MNPKATDIFVPDYYGEADAMIHAKLRNINVDLEYTVYQCEKVIAKIVNGEYIKV